MQSNLPTAHLQYWESVFFGNPRPPKKRGSFEIEKHPFKKSVIPRSHAREMCYTKGMSLSAFAPGRVEILGNHTDYNEGVVLSAALNLGTTISGAARGDCSILLRSSEATEVSTSLADIRPSGNWSDYPLGVVKMFAEAGADIPGFEANFTSTLPVGAGLSSSAALEVATAAFLMKLTGFYREPMDLAKLCRRAENEFVGVNCGLLDQVTSLFGEAEHAVFLDCRTEAVRTIPFPEDMALIIVDSDVKHALTGGEYNERRESCFEAARRLGVSALRDATSAALDYAQLPDLIHRRAAHIVGENDRVLRATEALQAGNPEVLGKLMSESHRSSRINFENSTPELDLLVEIAEGVNGVLGARLTGGGFGGAIVALANHSEAERIAKEIAGSYHEHSGHPGTALVCRPGDGAWRANSLDARRQ